MKSNRVGLKELLVLSKADNNLEVRFEIYKWQNRQKQAASTPKVIRYCSMLLGILYHLSNEMKKTHWSGWLVFSLITWIYLEWFCYLSALIWLLQHICKVKDDCKRNPQIHLQNSERLNWRVKRYYCTFLLYFNIWQFLSFGLNSFLWLCLAC